MIMMMVNSFTVICYHTVLAASSVGLRAVLRARRATTPAALRSTSRSVHRSQSTSPRSCCCPAGSDTSWTCADRAWAPAARAGTRGRPPAGRETVECLGWPTAHRPDETRPLDAYSPTDSARSPSRNHYIQSVSTKSQLSERQLQIYDNRLRVLKISILPLNPLNSLFLTRNFALIKKLFNKNEMFWQTKFRREIVSLLPCQEATAYSPQKKTWKANALSCSGITQKIISEIWWNFAERLSMAQGESD